MSAGGKGTFTDIQLYFPVQEGCGPAVSGAGAGHAEAGAGGAEAERGGAQDPGRHKGARHQGGAEER